LRDLGPKIKLQQALVLEENAPLEVPPISKQKPLESGLSFLVFGRATLSGENKTPLKGNKCQIAMLNRFRVKRFKGRRKVITSYHKMKQI
jgi:hypothetical protein